MRKNPLGNAHTTAKLSVYVPSTHNYFIGDNKTVMPANPVIREQVVSWIETILANKFGGASTVQLQGSWIDSNNGALIHEDITQVYALVNEVTADTMLLLQNIGQAIKALFNQDSVLVSVDYSSQGWFI